MPVPRSVAFAVVTALLPVAGCVETPPGPLPQATPSWSCTPVAGGTPYACYEHQYQQTSAQNKLYEEAEAVYRKFNAEDERIYRLGGVARPTSVLRETLAHEALDSVMTNYEDLRSDGSRLAEGHFATAWIKRQPDNLKAGSIATLWVCNDISSTVVQQNDGSREQVGQDLRAHVYMVEESDKLKIGSFSSEWVKTC